MAKTYKNQYPVTLVTDAETGNIAEEVWRDKNGYFSRPNGPAIQVFDPETNKRLNAQYYKNGVYHRPEEDGPAIQHWSKETGKPIFEEYKVNGITHRSDRLPAITYFDAETGKPKEVCYLENGDYIDPKTGRLLYDDEQVNFEP